MSLWQTILTLLGSGASARIAQDAAPPRQPDAPRERFNPAAGGLDIEALRAMLGAKGVRPDFNPFTPAKPPPWVPKSAGMAMDDAGAFGQVTDWAGQNLSSILFDREGFLGYPELAHLAQRPEYRSPVEIISEDSTAQWIEIQSAGEDEGKSEKIREIEDRFTDLGVKRAFKQASEHDGFFGRGHIYIDLGEEGDELKTPIRDASGKIAKAKIGRGKLKGIVNREPVWIWPQNYNTTNPLKDDFYVPKSWVCMTQEVDASRMLTFIARPVPDLLKAAYMFGGLSATQMMKPTVTNWLRTRKGVGDLVLAYATMVLSTNMVDVLNLGGADPQVPGGSPAGVFRRAELFNLLRDNLGLFLMDKESEDFKNVSTPLSGLDALQSQAQEHQASPLRIPGIKMFGIQPAGMNASSVGEISIYKGTIFAYQEHLYRSPIQTLLEIVQCDMYGEVDPDISFRFRELVELTALEKADLELKRAQTATIHIDNNSISPLEERRRIAEDPDTPYDSLDVDKPVPLSPESRKIMADTDQVLIDEGIISAEEARERVASDPDGGYGDLKGTPPPDLLREEESGLEPQGGRPQLQQTELQQGMPQGEEEGGPTKGAGPKAPLSSISGDAQWEEGKHKRGQPKNAGQFGPGGGGHGASQKPAKSEGRKDFWTYHAATETPAEPPPGSPMSVKEWESLSPGMRREIYRGAKQKAGMGERPDGDIKAPEGEKPGNWSDIKSEDDPAFKPYREAIDGVCDKLGFDRAKVNIEFEAKWFELGGKRFNYAGSAATMPHHNKPGTITIYPNQASLSSIAGTTAHEVEHIRFQEFVDKRNAERDAVMKEPAAESGYHDFMRSDGSLEPPYDEKYPHYSAWVEAWEKVPLEVFAKSDGVSDYSKTYWDLWHEGKMDTQAAVHETFAEMMRIKLMTGKFPDHMHSGPMPKAHKSKDYPEGFSTTRGVKGILSEGAKAWRRAFKVINGEN